MGEVIQLEYDARYLQARKDLASMRMKPIPHAILDKLMVEGRIIMRPTWADEIYAHPEKGGLFRKGRDIKDARTGWRIPASDVPAEAFERKGVGLFVVPGDIDEKNGVAIIPKSILILGEEVRVVENNGGIGRAHSIARIPLIISSWEFKHLPEEEKRWLYRIEGEGVRPLVRGIGGGCGWREIIAGYEPDVAFAVAGVPIGQLCLLKN